MQSQRSTKPNPSPSQPDGRSLPIAVAPGHITPPAPCSSEVSEVMRSCGGAVQGVREVRQPGGGVVNLNRQVSSSTAKILYCSTTLLY